MLFESKKIYLYCIPLKSQVKNIRYYLAKSIYILISIYI